MKCKVCGHRTNSLAAMSDHYRKKHPQKMKRTKRTKVREPRDYGSSAPQGAGGARFCKWCGGRVD